MGANGQLYAQLEMSFPSNANAKTVTMAVGGVNIIATAQTTSVYFSAQKWLTNRGSTATQISRAAGSAATGLSGVSPTQLTIDTENNQTVRFSGTLAAASDFVVMENFNVLTYFAG
jgi:hypothetical protein